LPSAFLSALSGPRSASILNLDHVAVWIGQVSVGSNPTVITAHDQPPAKFRYGGDGAFVVLHTWQHIAEMRHSTLHASQVDLTRILFRASSWVPLLRVGF
jgi:hypothetical protein